MQCVVNVNVPLNGVALLIKKFVGTSIVTGKNDFDCFFESV